LIFDTYCANGLFLELKILKTEYHSMVKYFYIITLLLVGRLSFAQVVNAEREIGTDTVTNKWELNGTFSISSDKQKNNIVDIDASLAIAKYLQNKYVLIGIFKNQLVFSGRKPLQNEGWYHLRYRDNDSRKISPEYFFQYQWNGAWGMQYRVLTGANCRLQIAEKNKGDFYLGLGMFREWEMWNWSGVKLETLPDQLPTIKTEKWRLNNYIKIAKKINDKIDVSSTSYLQFPLKDEFLHPRWYFELDIFYRAEEKLNFVFHFDHIWDEKPVVPIDHYYYSYSMGVQIKL